jgi:glycosyltransferase involved in cell wall biosynthesis
MIEGGLRTRGSVKRGDADAPLVSVITVVRNGMPLVERTIDAILSQTYPNVEYIVVDGASSDGTVELLGRHDARIDYWLSEPDAGLYDAMNKGVALVSDAAAYVMFANSDDRLYEADTIERLVRAGKGADFVYGKQVLTDGETSAVLGSEVDLKDLARRNISHAATLIRRRVFDTVGKFDLKYKLVADYDFFIRCFQHPVESRFVDQIVAEVSMFGLSETQFRLLLRERLDVIATRFGVIPRLAATAQIYCYDIPRNFLRGELRKRGLLSRWRAIKGM